MGILANNFERAVFSGFTGYRLDGQSYWGTLWTELRQLDRKTQAGEALKLGFLVLSAWLGSHAVFSGHEGAAVAHDASISHVGGKGGVDTGQVSVTCAEGGIPSIKGSESVVKISCHTTDGTPVDVMRVDGLGDLTLSTWVTPPTPVATEAPVALDIGFSHASTISSGGGLVNTVTILAE